MLTGFLLVLALIALCCVMGLAVARIFSRDCSFFEAWFLWDALQGIGHLIVVVLAALTGSDQ